MEQVTKECTKCKTHRAISDFPKDTKRTLGVGSHCNECHRAYYLANKERVSLQRKSYRLLNRDKIKHRKAEEYQANKEKDLARSKAYRLNNKERISAQKRAYRLRNKGKVSAREKAYKKANADREAKRKRLHRQANKERISAQKRAYWQANRAHGIARGAAYRKANKARISALLKAWYRANKDRHKAKCLAWREAHPENVKLAHQRRKVNVRKWKSDITPESLRQLTEVSDGMCAYCLRTGLKLEIEHVYPLAKGGSHTMDNIVLACRECNAMKGANGPLHMLNKVASCSR